MSSAYLFDFLPVITLNKLRDKNLQVNNQSGSGVGQKYGPSNEKAGRYNFAGRKLTQIFMALLLATINLIMYKY